MTEDNKRAEETPIRAEAAPGRNRRRRRKPRQSEGGGGGGSGGSAHLSEAQAMTPTSEADTTARAQPKPALPSRASGKAGTGPRQSRQARPTRQTPDRQSAARQLQAGQPDLGQSQDAPQVTASATNTSATNTSDPQAATPNSARTRQQRQRRRGRGSSDITPPVMAPPSRGRKRPLAEPRIAVGCIVLRGDEILLVRERGRWSLPKGGLEVGELLQDGARRETYEETGLIVEMRDLAFVVEFMAETWGHHLQFFYQAREVGGTLAPLDPDRDVQEAKFVPVRQLREYLRFRPRLVALETWLRERRTRHFVFNLDKEPAMLRKRRRVDMARVSRRRAMQAEEVQQDNAAEPNLESPEEWSAEAFSSADDLG